MIPLTENPSVVIRLNAHGNLVAVASNVAQDLNVTVVTDPDAFNDEAANKPFNSLRPLQPTQVLAMRK